MMRRLAPVIAALMAASAVAAQAAPAPAILYVAGRSCPARNPDCSGIPAYDNKRIYEIAKIGYPAHALSTAATDDSQPVRSPDRTRIVFLRVTSTGVGYNLWLMNADASGQKQLTPGKGVNVEPSWSPSGSQIVFRGDSPDGQTFDLYTIKTDGSGRTNITSNPDNIAATNPDWSPNGKRIVFQRTNYTSSSTGVYVVNPDGSALKKLTVSGGWPAWSPNGRMIAFIRVDPASGGRFQVYVMRSNGTGQVKLTSGPESVAPAWSPNGKQIVFVRGRQIAVMNADGSGIKQLTKPLDGTDRFVDTPDW